MNDSENPLYTWTGHWAWIHVADIDGPELGKRSGRIDDLGVGLPPEFSVKADRLGLWRTINDRLGTMLDIYENDEVSDPAQLRIIADIVEPFFTDEPDRGIAGEIAVFLRELAHRGEAVEFWL